MNSRFRRLEGVHLQVNHGLVALLWLCTITSHDCIAQIQKTEQRGPVVAKLELTPEQPLIGDPITLTISVLAEKDVELLMPEFGEALDRFTILDFVPRNEILSSGQTQAVQQYRLQPPLSGKQAIPPILIEFVDRRPGQREAPDGMDAFELLTPRIEFEVQSVVPTSASREMKPPLGELQPLGMTQTQRLRWLLVAAVVILLATLPFLIKWMQARQRHVRRQSAYEIARTRLTRLTSRPLPQGESIDGYFVELSHIVRQYLEDRFDLRAPELTTEEFLETVSDSGELSHDHQGILQQFLKQADLVKFAGLQPNPNEIQRAVGLAERFIEDTRENAPLIDVSGFDEKLNASQVHEPSEVFGA